MVICKEIPGTLIKYPFEPGDSKSFTAKTAEQDKGYSAKNRICPLVTYTHRRLIIAGPYKLPSWEGRMIGPELGSLGVWESGRGK